MVLFETFIRLCNSLSFVDQRTQTLSLINTTIDNESGFHQSMLLINVNVCLIVKQKFEDVDVMRNWLSTYFLQTFKRSKTEASLTKNSLYAFKISLLISLLTTFWATPYKTTSYAEFILQFVEVNVVKKTLIRLHRLLSIRRMPTSFTTQIKFCLLPRSWLNI